MALDIFSPIPFTILFADVLSVATSVGGCGWSISAMAIRIDVAFWYFSNNPPNSATLANSMIFLIILHSTCTGPFSAVISVIGVLFLDFGPRKKYPPALLHACLWLWIFFPPFHSRFYLPMCFRLPPVLVVVGGPFLLWQSA